MSKDEQKLLQEIIQHITLCGGNADEWYAGVADNADRALFIQHLVLPNKDVWIHKNAGSIEAAKSILNELTTNFGLKGIVNEQIENPNSTIIYVYKKQSHTKP